MPNKRKKLILGIVTVVALLLFLLFSVFYLGRNLIKSQAGSLTTDAVLTSGWGIVSGWLFYAVLYGCPLMYGTIGEILTEKSGNLNLGVEGLMFMGGAFGLGGVFYYERAVNAAGGTANPWLALLIALFASFAIGAFGALLFSFVTVTLRANQNVAGLALTIFGTGAAQFFGEFMRVDVGGFVSLSKPLQDFFYQSPLPKFLQEIPVIGKLIFGYNIFVYLGIVIAVVLAWYLKRTRKGLYLRAVGESPATADAAGIRVTRNKYIATVLGGGISAIGGMVFITTIAQCVWNHEGLSGVGWLAVALVIFCLWDTVSGIWASILFGALIAMYNYYPLPFFTGAMTEFYKILPYVVTVIVLVLSSIRNNREKQPPASLGLSYFREDR